MDEASSHNYTFQVTGPDGITSVCFSVSVADDTGWTEIVGRFGDFMSAVYGYRIDELDALRG